MMLQQEQRLSNSMNGGTAFLQQALTMDTMHPNASKAWLIVIVKEEEHDDACTLHTHTCSLFTHKKYTHTLSYAVVISLVFHAFKLT